MQNAIKLPTTPIRLRDLIRQVRAARTAADERAVVNKECADIRANFREEDVTWRCRNVAKLLYIHMLGYPAHFGQLECLKLVASHRFTDKRIGYLGAMLLLDEQTEVHLLITNCIKNDLNNTNQYIAGLALSALGEICSAEMCRDLVGEIEKLLKSSNSYLRKKAALCAVRMIQKVPSLMDQFMPVTRSLLTDKNHAVQITGMVLMRQMCEMNTETLASFKKLVPNIVRAFRALIMAGYNPDHDVSGISDPFLQVKMLDLLTVLGRNDAEASDMMNDILAQVATNTDGSKNVGGAVLYETVLAIMDIKSESGLRVLAVNILGRFLMNQDRNIRYVALNTLLKTVQIDNMAVQRHRSTVLECLKDPDVSIRKRAMELSFALVNTTNVRAMAKELLVFLETADNEFKAPCSSNLFSMCERYAPSRRWQIDTMIKALNLSGNYVSDHVVANIIQLIGEYAEEQTYAVKELFQCVQDPNFDAKQPLVQVACWSLGEFGDLLLSTGPISVGEEQQAWNISEQPVVDALENIIKNKHSWVSTREYALNALMKLSTRFTQMTGRIKQILAPLTANVSIEIQQRAVEYSSLFERPEQFRYGILERMPVVKRGTAADASFINGEEGLTVPHADDTDDLLGYHNDRRDAASKPRAPKHSDSLLGILDDMSILANETPVIHENGHSHQGSSTGGVADLLDLLDMNPSSAVPKAKPIASVSSSMPSALGDFDFLNDNTSNPALSAGTTFTAFEKNGLRIDFTVNGSADSSALDVTVNALNFSPEEMSDFVFQAAVPKVLQLQLFPPSSSTIPALGTGPVVQQMKLANPSHAPVKLRLRISYKTALQTVQEQAEVSNFPTSNLF